MYLKNCDCLNEWHPTSLVSELIVHCLQLLYPPRYADKGLDMRRNWEKVLFAEKQIQLNFENNLWVGGYN